MVGNPWTGGLSGHRFLSDMQDLPMYRQLFVNPSAYKFEAELRAHHNSRMLAALGFGSSCPLCARDLPSPSLIKIPPLFSNCCGNYKQSIGFAQND